MKYALSAGEEINLIDEDDSRRPKISSIIPSTKIRTICSDLFFAHSTQSRNARAGKRRRSISAGCSVWSRHEKAKNLYKNAFSSRSIIWKVRFV